MTPSHFDDQRIASLLDYPGVVAILDEAFRDLAAGQAHIHPRQRTDGAGLRLSSMGALWAARKVGGLKVYPTVQGQFSFLVTLFDLEHNVPLAVFDGAEITRFRTAALTALVAGRAAQAAPRKLALFGAGFQGRGQVQALCHQYDFAQIAVVDPAVDRAWCQQLVRESGSRVDICDARTAVEEADIVVTATRSAQPVFDGHWLKPGAFVAAIGTSGPQSRELDDATLSRASRIIVEWKPQSLQEAGELVLWNGSPSEREKVVDLAELYAQPHPWRVQPQDIIVCKAVGVGLSDVACAYLAYARHTQGHHLASCGALA
jgi:ornithine cyclodeaminase